MFQPETEDMLPRMAPKPSTDVPIGACDGIIRPQVPEVSILFGQNNENLNQKTIDIPSQQQEHKTFPLQTYADWKKKMLPKVNYSPSANMADVQLQENIVSNTFSGRATNLYPMRLTSAQPINMGSNANLMTFRRSSESCTNNMYQQIEHFPTLPPLATSNQSANTNLREVLTICAGTQTDPILDPNYYLQQLQLEQMANLASRKDVENIWKILDEVKVEQQRLLQMIETFLLNYHSKAPVKSKFHDIAVQADFIESGNINYDESIQHNDKKPKNKFLQQLKLTDNFLQTPKGKPIAQSTVYRPSSPQLQLLCQDLPQAACAPAIIPKSSSDTSLAMNELALKYLPNEKLSELLKELNIDYPKTADINTPTTVGANVDKFEKGSSDISNASYKYLKKYRLLPEDNAGNVNKNAGNEADGGNPNKMLQNNSAHIRSTTNQRVIPVVNLENIKHQPKFL